MKTFIFLSSMVFSFITHADVNCSAHFFVQADSISGHCSSGYCTAYYRPQTISGYGSCAKGITFYANNQPRAQFLNGNCVNGRISIYKNAEKQNWYGRCSNGGFFTATPAWSSPEYLYGNCSSNGYISVYIPSDYISLTARCSQ